MLYRSSAIGYTASISVFHDTTAATDSADVVIDDGFIQETGDDDTDDSGTSDETQFPDTDDSETPAIEPVTTDDDSGGGCFLWPF